MALADISSRQAVLDAVREFDRRGRDEFLRRYRFGKARRYFLVIDGRRYDSKAIVGVAHGYQFPSKGRLRFTDFRGGESTVQPLLERLGFSVEVR